MPHIAKKVCIIGDFAVGKTSTVARFVKNVFSEKYLTTVGVKIDTKEMTLSDGRQLKMVIWDIAGSERFSAVEFSYLRGAQAYVLVADGTRGETMTSALALREAVEKRFGKLPFVLLINKNDLQDSWEVSGEQIASLRKAGMVVLCTSARTGQCVERAFQALADALVATG